MDYNELALLPQHATLLEASAIDPVVALRARISGHRPMARRRRRPKQDLRSHGP